MPGLGIGADALQSGPHLFSERHAEADQLSFVETTGLSKLGTSRREETAAMR